MALTNEEIERVAQLARLSLSPEEIERFRTQLSTILDHIEKLQGLDVSGVEPTINGCAEAGTPLREDVARPGLSQEEALANAPVKEGPFFLVPRIIE